MTHAPHFIPHILHHALPVWWSTYYYGRSHHKIWIIEKNSNCEQVSLWFYYNHRLSVKASSIFISTAPKEKLKLIYAKELTVATVILGPKKTRAAVNDLRKKNKTKLTHKKTQTKTASRVSSSWIFCSVRKQAAKNFKKKKKVCKICQLLNTWFIRFLNLLNNHSVLQVFISVWHKNGNSTEAICRRNTYMSKFWVSLFWGMLQWAKACWEFQHSIRVELSYIAYMVQGWEAKQDTNGMEKK